jgi:CBS domain-containing protein
MQSGSRLLTFQENLDKEGTMKVRAVMNKPVQTVSSDSSLAEAGKRMAENDCGVLPVVDGKCRVVGILTDRDVCLALATKNRLASEISALEVMSPHVCACGPDDDLSKALETMRHRLVRRLPVVDDAGRLVGILSIDDIIIHAGPASATPEGVTYGEAFRTMRAVCGTRVTHPPLIVSA